jgi:hypothetical protein
MPSSRAPAGQRLRYAQIAVFVRALGDLVRLFVSVEVTFRCAIELGDELVEILKELVEINAGGDLLFPSADGTPFRASNFYKRYWIPLLLACELAEAFSGEEAGAASLGKPGAGFDLELDDAITDKAIRRVTRSRLRFCSSAIVSANFWASAKLRNVLATRAPLLCVYRTRQRPG